MHGWVCPRGHHLLHFACGDGHPCNPPWDSLKNSPVTITASVLCSEPSSDLTSCNLCNPGLCLTPLFSPSCFSAPLLYQSVCYEHLLSLTASCWPGRRVELMPPTSPACRCRSLAPECHVLLPLPHAFPLLPSGPHCTAFTRACPAQGSVPEVKKY